MASMHGENQLVSFDATTFEKFQSLPCALAATISVYDGMELTYLYFNASVAMIL